jgi:DNA-binding transcriptional LysR family regulator
MQRTTHHVRLTEAGMALQMRCTEILARIVEATDYISSLNASPKGCLKISAGIGFGYFALAEILPSFMERYPGVDVSVDLTSRSVDLVAEGIDVAIRMGEMADSRLVTTGIGRMHRYLCAAPSYLTRRGVPQNLEELKNHTTVEMPGNDGTPRTWRFHVKGREVSHLEVPPRLLVNDPGMIHRLVVNGAGIACISGYVAGPDILTGRLVRLFPEWELTPVEVSVLYPSNRALSSTVRAFVEHIKHAAKSGTLWMDDPIARRTQSAILPKIVSDRSPAGRLDRIAPTQR